MPIQHDPLTCGIYSDLSCPDCRAAMEGPAVVSSDERRRRERGRRLAALVRQHADELRPVLLDLLAADMAAIVEAISGT
jgi:hypothetical protein